MPTFTTFILHSTKSQPVKLGKKKKYKATKSISVSQLSDWPYYQFLASHFSHLYNQFSALKSFWSKYSKHCLVNRS